MVDQFSDISHILEEQPLGENRPSGISKISSIRQHQHYRGKGRRHFYHIRYVQNGEMQQSCISKMCNRYFFHENCINSPKELRSA